jgi:hypothetical protein
MTQSRRFFLTLLLLILPLLSPSSVIAVHCNDSDYLNFENVPTLKSFECVFESALGIMLQLLGLAMFVMLVYGGFKFLTAGGDAKAAEGAKATITFAVTGLVLGIAAWFILVLIRSFTGIDLQNFSVGLGN